MFCGLGEERTRFREKKKEQKKEKKQNKPRLFCLKKKNTNLVPVGRQFFALLV